MYAKKALPILVFLLEVATPAVSRGSWIFGANAGTGVPLGQVGDFFGPSALIGGSVGSTTGSFEFGLDLSRFRASPTQEYQSTLSYSNAEGALRVWHLGVHAHWVASEENGMVPYVGMGAGMYDARDELKGSYDSVYEDRSFGINARAGLNYWMSPKWGIGLDFSYHPSFFDTGYNIPYDRASYLSFSGGVRVRDPWKR
jgi:outer membrane protein W